MTITVGSTQYRALARRYAALLAQKAPGDYTAADLAEIYAVSDAMIDAEMAHRPGPIEAVADDYEFAIRQAGCLSGAEI